MGCTRGAAVSGTPSILAALWNHDMRVIRRGGRLESELDEELLRDSQFQWLAPCYNSRAQPFNNPSNLLISLFREDLPHGRGRVALTYIRDWPVTVEAPPASNSELTPYQGIGPEAKMGRLNTSERISYS